VKQEIIWKNAVNLSDMIGFSRIIKIDIKREVKQRIYEKAIKIIGSKRKLARIIGYGYRNIDEWIKGKQDSIGLNIFKQLCDITSISLDDLQESIIKIKTANYFEVDKEILQFLEINRNNRYTTTDIVWNIKRRRFIVSSSLQRLLNQNFIKRENNPNRHGSYLYYNNNLQKH